MANYLSMCDQKVHLIFQNHAPWVSSFSNGSKVKESVYRDGFIVNNSHQFFRESRYQSLETFFYHFFALTLWSWHLFSFSKKSAKFIMTKGVQNKFKHFMQMLTSKQSLHFSRSVFTNANIHEQKTKRLSLVDLVS